MVIVSPWIALSWDGRDWPMTPNAPVTVPPVAPYAAPSAQI
jgi:hypothetical protein